MSIIYTVNARRLGIAFGIGTALLIALYAATLIAGFLSLQSPKDPIADPYFSSLEILILLLMPIMVGLMSAVHAWAPTETKIFSLLALIFMSLSAGITCGVHFVILTIGQRPELAYLDWMPLILSFSWPSVVYALDILAWDVFFALSVLFAAPVFRGKGLVAVVRLLLIVSGMLALAGLSGVATANMQLRNIGIVGYVGVFPVVAALLAVLFFRTTSRQG